MLALVVAAAMGCGAGGAAPPDGSRTSGGGVAGVRGAAGTSGGPGGADAGATMIDAGVAIDTAPDATSDRADAGDAPRSTDGADDARDGDEHEVPALVPPIERGGLDVLQLGSLQFQVNPAIGARIVGLSLGGDELLTDARANAQFYGSTLWTSPADDWVKPGTFVPPPVVDNLPYTTTVSVDGVVTATSGAYTTPNGKAFTLTKVFHADPAHEAIVIDYQITNVGPAPYQLSHWEVTRVFPDGLTFFSTPPTAPKVDFLAQPVKLQTAQGFTWYDNQTHVAGKGESKMGAQSAGGFIAHVAPHVGGDLLFVKAFKPIVPPDQPPTGHYDVELYCNDPHTYVELEEHSAFKTIMPGATYTQTSRWYVRRLPVGTDRSIGSPALVAAVKGLLGL